MFTRTLVVAALVCGLAAPARFVAAQIPSFANPVLFARTGITSLHLPHGSSLSSPTISLNDARDVTLDVNFVGNTGNPGVFFGQYNAGNPLGGIVVDTDDTIAGDPHVNNHGQVVYTVGFDDDPFVYDSVNDLETAINYPLGVTGSANLLLTDHDQLGGRLDIGFEGDVYGLFERRISGNPQLIDYVRDNEIDASSPYSFLFTPDTSNRGGPIGGPAGAPRIAGKVSLAANFDFEQIRIFDADETSVLVADEIETDPASTFSEFVTNRISISSDGTNVAFQANDLSGTSGIYRYDAATGMIDQIAAEGSGPVGTIDFFAPDVNDTGLVVFRGDDQNGLSSVFMGDGVHVTRLAGEGDQVATDIGMRQLGRRDTDFSQSGAPRLNNEADVAYIFQYFDPTNPGSVADGSLVLMSTARGAGDFNGDGIYDCDDIDWLTLNIATNTNDLLFDLTDDGIVDLDDRDAWLAEAGGANLPSGNPYLLGDADLDGTVDGMDFVVWNRFKFSAVSFWCRGDFNADGNGDGLDFVIWNQHKFQSADVPHFVPEPTGVAWVFGWLGLCFARQRGSCRQLRPSVKRLDRQTPCVGGRTV